MRSSHRLCFALLSVYALAGCAAPAPEANPVLLVGLDGFEWSVALPLARDGQLPHLRGLMERGTWGRLGSFAPGKSPTLWTSAATGMDADGHGILGFVKQAGSGTPRRLYTSLDRKVPAFWNILTEHGARTAVIGWWNTYPAEAVAGVVVAQVNTIGRDRPGEAKGQAKGALFEDREAQVYPPERAGEVLAVVPRVRSALPATVESIFGTMPESLPAVPSRLWENCLWSVRADATYRVVATQLLREQSFDVTAVYFGGSDVIAHRFWRYMEPTSYSHPPSQAEVATFGSVIRDYYRYLDGVLGELLAASPANSNVIVMSDHGMVPAHRDRHFESGDRLQDLLSADHEEGQPGILVAAGPDIRDAGPDVGSASVSALPELGSVLDITPTLLVLRSLPVGRDMDGVALVELLDEGFRARGGIAWVDSHTPPDWAARRTGDEVVTPDSTERLEQLRTLGYVD